MSDCPICVEPYNRSTRLIVTCGFCQYECCRACVKTYLLQHPVAKCIQCQVEWTPEMLTASFTKAFLCTEYKRHREQCLFDAEKAMLPATQVVVEQLAEEESIVREINGKRSMLKSLRQEICSLERTLYLLRRRGNEAPRKSFVRKCMNTSCRGFLSSQWKCHLCGFKTCKECLQCIDSDGEHKCDPNNIETAKLLAKECKTCPNCGEMIFKIDGCDQMYCTQCHTPFSWSTGRKVTGAIHNPHYFEWMRKQNASHARPEDAIEVRCGREIDHAVVRKLNSIDYRDTFADVCRQIIHLRHTVLPHFTTHRYNENEDLRIAYLRKQISESQFKSTLQKREKATAKKRNIYHIIAMVIQCVTEIVFRFIQDATHKLSCDEYTVYESELFNLIIYANECLQNVSKMYSCICYHFSNDLQFKVVTASSKP